MDGWMDGWMMMASTSLEWLRRFMRTVVPNMIRLFSECPLCGLKWISDIINLISLIRSGPIYLVNGPMAFRKTWGRMSIRVKGYDFFSKSCYICEPISHIILLRAPQCYIFCRKASGLLLITTLPLAVNGLFACSTLAL
jgi:hypothetical protein